MDAITLLKDLVSRPVAVLDYAWDDLTPDKLNAHPGGHANSPAWLLWHTGREIDAQVAHLAGYEQVWTAQGFAERFNLSGVEPGAHGYGHSAAEANSVTVPETDAGKALLREHIEAVIARVQEYLGTLEPADLDRIIDTSRSPHVSVGVRLVSVIEDALQHIGQASYVAGMRELN